MAIGDKFAGILSVEEVNALNSIISSVDSINAAAADTDALSELAALGSVSSELADLGAASVNVLLAGSSIAFDGTTPTTVTSGAIPVNSVLTFVTVANTQAYTMANGTVKGQRKIVRCTGTSGTPAGTLTPATPSGFATVVFSAAKDWAEFVWNGSAWYLAQDATSLGTLATLASSATNILSAASDIALEATAPTTITTGAIPVTSTLSFISIDGTKGYTLANGTVAGQRKILRCTVAANTPVGTVTPATPTGFSTVVLTAVEDFCEMIWSGSAWYLASKNVTPP